MKGDKEAIEICKREEHKQYFGMQKFDISIRYIENTDKGSFIYWVESPLCSQEEIAHKSNLMKADNNYYFYANGVKIEIN